MFRLGEVVVEGLARLAPMAGITNAPFRLVARECGSGLTTSEEIDAQSVLVAHRHTELIAAYYPEERPLVMQLLGKDPDTLAAAAARLAERGADVIDLNMGCPMPKVTAKGKGAALMRDLPRTARILQAMRRAVGTPLTVKIRSGWDDAHVNAVEVARLAEGEGVDGIAVHPRSSLQRYAGTAPWRVIADVVRAVRIPVTGNGDVRSLADARRMVAETGCHSVMIGRGALGRPWVFDAGYEALREADRCAYRARVIAHHIELVRTHFPERYVLAQLKRHLACYADGLDEAAGCRRRLLQSRAPDEAVETFWAAFAAGPETRAAGQQAGRPTTG